jgi:hypothetical protein
MMPALGLEHPGKPSIRRHSPLTTGTVPVIRSSYPGQAPDHPRPRRQKLLPNRDWRSDQHDLR